MMSTVNGEMIYTHEPKRMFLGALKRFASLFQSVEKPKAISMETHSMGLTFEELNPLLAKQLTEVEVQLGQLALVQFEMNEERRRMNESMKALQRMVADQADARLYQGSDRLYESEASF